MRKSGILLPISSIPSRFGIGTFSTQAYAFVDFLVRAGQKLWQILPLGPTGYGDSPYQSFSTFAGNPYYIDLDTLIRDGLLKEEECLAVDYGGSEHYVDYEKIYHCRLALLKKAYLRAGKRGLEASWEYRRFLEENAYWLEDYCLYTAVKGHFGGVCWVEWDEGIRLRRPEAMNHYRRLLAGEVGFYRFLQYEFFTQWQALKAYANGKGIQIVGDIPIYVAFDSADAWGGPELFWLDEKHLPKSVAGCPPDAFSATGQLWGNPLYDWDYHRRTGFQWWMNRITHCYRLYDVLRIDHFRGFDEYWAVPYGDATAQGGHWRKGPGIEFFHTMKARLGDRPVIAEDLGFLTPSVKELLRQSGYPGMKVLQFAFDSDEYNDYLPHNYERNCVVYTGTHDNDTTLGWLEEKVPHRHEAVYSYLGMETDCKEPQYQLIRAALSSAADTAIIPMQDYLGLGREARINTPSTLGDNWKWRMDRDAATQELAERIYRLTKMYRRL